MQWLSFERKQKPISKKIPHLSFAAKPYQSELVDVEEDYEAEINANECRN